MHSTHRDLLVTVSRDQSAQYGARFICDFFRNKENLGITLYYTATRPVPDSSDSSIPAFEGLALRESELRSRERLGREALDQARQFLVNRGISHDNIRSRLHFHKTSKVMDIVQEGERGLYDAVVLGSRGLGWLEELVSDSVSREMLDKRLTLPLWVCRKPEMGRRNVLACVDDSEQAFRMVDHVGFMLDYETAQEVTLLNIYDPNSGDRVFADEIFERCRDILMANGVEPERIRRRVAESYNVSKGILDIAERDKYAVVAAGRTGEDRGLMRRLFMGSVSRELYRNLTGAVLWLSR